MREKGKGRLYGVRDVGRKHILAAGVSIAAVVVIIVSFSFAASSQLGRMQSDYESLDDFVTCVGKPVCFLGKSHNTGFIVDRLWLSTHKITITENLSDLSSLSPDVLLMIDGEWAARNSLRDLADAIRPLILQRTPVVLLNMTSDLLGLAVENTSLSIGSCYYSSNRLQETMIPTMFHGFIYFLSEDRASQIGLGHSNSSETFAESITTLYEWSELMV